MKTTWDYVTTVESETEPGATYDIKQRRSDGHLGCSCTAYRFAPKSAKTCKHIIALNEDPTPLLSARTQPTIQTRTVSKGTSYTFTRRAITFGDIPIGR